MEEDEDHVVPPTDFVVAEILAVARLPVELKAGFHHRESRSVRRTVRAVIALRMVVFAPSNEIGHHHPAASRSMGIAP